MGAGPGHTALVGGRWHVALEAGLPVSAVVLCVTRWPFCALSEFKDYVVFDEGGQDKSDSVSFLSSHVGFWHLASVPRGHLHPCSVPSFPGALGVRFKGLAPLCHLFSSQGSSCAFVAP